MAATRTPARTGAKAPPHGGGSKPGSDSTSPPPGKSGSTAPSRREPALELAVQRAVAATDLPVRATLLRWARAALERDARVTLRFVGTAEGRALNSTYRGRDYATNVLTFVYDSGAPLAGDIVVCMPVVRREARAQRKSLRAHLAHLVVHGMLHLQGHDHERDADATAMEARETAILRRLRYADPYAPA
jgi:probable rRNA maturation factor